MHGKETEFNAKSLEYEATSNQVFQLELRTYIEIYKCAGKIESLMQNQISQSNIEKKNQNLAGIKHPQFF